MPENQLHLPWHDPEVYSTSPHPVKSHSLRLHFHRNFAQFVSLPLSSLNGHESTVYHSLSQSVKSQLRYFTIRFCDLLFLGNLYTRGEGELYSLFFLLSNCSLAILHFVAVV
jgi:hypothetical protein